ncbi:MAG TPA: hypothetical protein VF799_07555 [Geobacteraceae bacterium]
MLLIPLLCFAVNSWGTLTGQGTIRCGSGLFASGDNCSDLSSALIWKVVQLDNGYYEYNYSLNFPREARNITCVITQVAKNFSAGDMLKGTTPNGRLSVWDGGGKSNQGIPAPMYGIKWDLSFALATSVSWTIVTDRAPMFGRFYARGDNFKDGLYVYSGAWGFFESNVVVPGPFNGGPADVGPPSPELSGISVSGIKKE